MNALKNKTVLITGGNRGIGLALARLLGRAGAQLVIIGRDRGSLKKAADLLKRDKVRVLAFSCDITDAVQVEKLFQKIRKHHSSIHTLINNAGVAHALAPVDQLSVEAWNQVIATNLTGTFLVTHFALPLMPAGATIVNNLSVAAVQSFPGMAAYNASKAGALSFTNVLREDLRKRSIRVLAVVAGPTDTDIWNQFWADAPRNKMISPETVAQAILDALIIPVEATIEQIKIGPAAGSLR